MSLTKWAVDSTAKEYWTKYYKEYGKSWVKDIPKRVKRAMATNQKVAHADFGVVTPVGTSVTADGVFLEGMFRAAGSGEQFLFYAEFNHEGKIKRFDSTKLAG
jgi:hypothetical protein